MVAAAARPRVAYGEPDPSFVLTTTSTAFDGYFPSYLANGYLSTMTGARGTESNLAYLVAFMDYTKEDIARPAAIPGWSGIDYSTGKSSAGEFWLKTSSLARKASPAIARRSTCMTAQLSDAATATRDDSRKSTDVRVVTFASQAAPHLARPSCRSPRRSPAPCNCSSGSPRGRRISRASRSARMSGDEMQAAVAANAMNVLEPVNHATPDRAPVWYYGLHRSARPGRRCARI